MTQENKNSLLLNELSTRLSYYEYKTNVHVEGHIGGNVIDFVGKLVGIINGKVCVEVNSTYGYYESYSLLDNNITIKPYLRPTSSMTKEESNEYRMFIEYSYNDFTGTSTPCVYVDKIKDYIDWLNAHHFDYCGLIEKGLALEAPEDMYNF